MRYTWKTLLATALIVASSAVVLRAASNRVTEPAPTFSTLYSGPVVDPGDGVDDPAFPPTFCADGADCGGCYSACRHAYDDCMKSQPYCHQNAPGPRDPRCDQVCGTGQNRCFSQAVANCR